MTKKRKAAKPRRNVLRDGPSPIDRAIGARLRVFRLGKKMSQDELGKALGVTFQQIQKYENGKNRISGSRLVTICRTLECTSEEILGTEGDRVSEEQFGALHDKRTSNAFIAISRLNSVQRAAVIDVIHSTIRGFGGQI